MSMFIPISLQYKGAYKNTNPQDMDYSLLLEDDNLDASPSEPLEITLPKNQDGEGLFYNHGTVALPPLPRKSPTLQRLKRSKPSLVPHPALGLVRGHAYK